MTDVAKMVKDDIINWTRQWFAVNGKGCNAVIGISGGKDSSISAALLVEALGKDRVIGVQMPCGEQGDINYSDEIIELLGIKSCKVNIKDAVDSVVNEMMSCSVLQNPNVPSYQTRTNLPARIRMATLYAISQSVNGRVCNTCNRSEDFVGYCTMYGDNCGDFALLKDLLVCEVKEIGYALGLPKKFIEKTPSDGLCGKTDEDNLGFKYSDVDKMLSGASEMEDLVVMMKIQEAHDKNEFKENLYIDHYEIPDGIEELFNPFTK